MFDKCQLLTQVLIHYNNLPSYVHLVDKVRLSKFSMSLAWD